MRIETVQRWLPAISRGRRRDNRMASRERDRSFLAQTRTITEPLPEATAAETAAEIAALSIADRSISQRRRSPFPWHKQRLALAALALWLLTTESVAQSPVAAVASSANSGAVSEATPHAVPNTVAALFADFDPRRDPLDVRVVRSWEHDGIHFRTLTFHIGTFRGEPARMAAFFAAPSRAERVPGLLHLHGGGQRAFLHEVEFYARRGYACLSINWGGREMEQAQPGDPNTDWGAVDPTQNNVPGYNNLQPQPRTIDAVESPRNNNWYLLTLGARRGLTFLEQQPEVDPQRLGVYGHSMGGNLTVYVAGSDARVKAAAPSVGGSGFRTQPWPLLPAYRPTLPNGSVALFDATLGFESYAARVQAPLLWLSSTNDFHGIMDDIYRTGALIPQTAVRYSFTPHMNHRFTADCSVTRPLWFDQHLRGQFAFPTTPGTLLHLATADHVPVLEVTADRPQDVAAVQVFYSIDPEPRARFWRSASVQPAGLGRWTGRLPILSGEQPLFAFANVQYQLDKTPSEPHGRLAERFTLSSLMERRTPAELGAAGVQPTAQRETLIDNFAEGFRDWYTLSADNPHHWEFSTRKLTDPQWRGAAGDGLSLEAVIPESNELVILLTENFFRSYRGPMTEYFAVVKVSGQPGSQVLRWQPKDFRSRTGATLSSWEHVDVLSIRAYATNGDELIGSKQWAGPQPRLQRLFWEPPSQ